MSALDERPIAYSYVRMSSQQQVKGDSLRRQLDLSEAYAEQHNLTLDHSLRDIGVSAWTGANVKSGALGRFLELVQTGKVTKGSYLLVESLDRLSRERVIDALEPFLSILRAGIIVVTLADNQVYSAESVGSNFTQLMMSLAIMARAHEESQIKSHRITQAHARRRADAAKGIGKFSAQMFGWIDQVEVAPKTYEYRLNEHANTIRKIFELSDEGLGCLKIERELIRLGMMGVKGKPISNGNIAMLLKNEAAIGTYQPTHKVDGVKVPYGEPLKEFLPAAVPAELYWRVQRNKRKPPQSGRKGAGFTNLFPGLLCCAHCGERLMMTIGGTPKHRHHYLQCHRRKVTNDCKYNHGTFRYDVLEKSILDNVAEFHQVDEQDGDPAQAKQNLIDAIERQKSKLADLEKRRSNLLATMEFAETETDRREMAAQLRLRRTDIEEAKSALTANEGDLRTFDARRRENNELADRVKVERMTWTTAGAAELYRSRSRVSVLIGKTLTQIYVDFQLKEVTVMIGHERIYLFNSGGSLIKKFDARQAGFYDTGTRHFVNDGGRLIAIRPKPWTENEMASDIPVGLDNERNERISLIKRLHETPNRPQTEVNPRLNDPEVIALKAKRQAAKSLKS